MIDIDIFVEVEFLKRENGEDLKLLWFGWWLFEDMVDYGDGGKGGGKMW